MSVPGNPIELQARHYGSEYAMADYKTKSQNLYLTTSYSYSPKLKFFGTVAFNKATAELDEVIMPDITSRLYNEYTDATDLTHQDFSFNEMYQYSDLDYEFLNFSLGMEYVLSKDVIWTVDGEYSDLTDNDGYVYSNESGSMFIIRSGIRFEF